jgi:hypothetical protein
MMINLPQNLRCFEIEVLVFLYAVAVSVLIGYFDCPMALAEADNLLLAMDNTLLPVRFMVGWMKPCLPMIPSVIVCSSMRLDN